MHGNYREFYDRITGGIRRRENGPRLLRGIDRLLRLLMELVYPVLLAEVFLAGFEKLGRTQRALALALAAEGVLPYLVIPGAGFVLLSLVRRKENWQRPYEEWDITPLIHRDGEGCSMPSRHAYSAAVIATCILQEETSLGILFLLLAGVVALCRVLGGVHYPEDVTAGYLTGVAVGSIVPCGVTVRSLRLLLVIGLLLAISLKDWKSCRIPNRLVLALAAVYAATFPFVEMESPSPDGGVRLLAEGLLAAALLGGGLLLVSKLYAAAAGRKGLGGGDIKLLAAAGLYLGLWDGARCLFLSCILGLVMARLSGRRRLPFGPAISIALVVLLCRQAV